MGLNAALILKRILKGDLFSRTVEKGESVDSSV